MTKVDQSLVMKPKFTCDICGKEYSSKQTLKNHKCKTKLNTEKVADKPTEEANKDAPDTNGEVPNNDAGNEESDEMALNYPDLGTMLDIAEAQLVGEKLEPLEELIEENYFSQMCDECGEVLADKNYLTDHMKKVHNYDSDITDESNQADKSSSEKPNCGECIKYKQVKAYTNLTHKRK